MKELEKENERLRKAVSDLTLEKLILKKAVSGKPKARAQKEEPLISGSIMSKGWTPPVGTSDSMYESPAA